MDPEGSLPHLQSLATVPYPEPQKSGQRLTMLLLEVPL